MKVILHIGSGKTGTTSIQRSLADRSRHLLRHGILYPVLAGDIVHNYLTVEFACDTPRRMLQRFGSRQRVAERSHQLWDLLRTAVQRNSPDTLVLSAERLFEAIPAEGFCERLHDFFPQISKLEIIAYLRRPSSLFASKIQQALRGSAEFPQPNRVPNANLLQCWRNQGSVRVFEFHRSLLQDGDIVSDFWHKAFPDLELKPAAGRVTENVSLSGEGIALLQRYRQQFFDDKNGLFLPETNALMRMISRIEQANPDNIRFTRPKLHGDIAEFIDYATTDNAELAREFGFRFHDLEMSRSALAFKPLRSSPYVDVEDVLAVDPDKFRRLHEYLTRAPRVPFLLPARVAGQLSSIDIPAVGAS